MSLLKRSGLLTEAMHPIMPDMECPTKTEDFKFISSIRAIISSAKASYEEYLTASKRSRSLTTPEKLQSNTKTWYVWAKEDITLSQTEWSPPYPCARIIVSFPEPISLAFMAVDKDFCVTMLPFWAQGGKVIELVRVKEKLMEQLLEYLFLFNDGGLVRWRYVFLFLGLSYIGNRRRLGQINQKYMPIIISGLA